MENNQEFEELEPQIPGPEEEPQAEVITEPVQPQAEVISQPVQPEARPAPAKKAGKAVIAALVALALVATSCGVTGIACFSRLAAQEKRSQQMLSQLQQQIKDLEAELNDKSFTGNGNSVSGTPNTAPGGLTPGQLYAQAVDSVVAITAEIVVNNGGSIATGVSTGTGFVLTESGYIVTNHHVVDESTKLTVTLHDGTSYAAKLRGSDATNDLAVLKIDAPGLKPVKLGSSDDLIVGDQVAVIGNPLGELTATLTVGYVSAKDRVVSTDGSQINMLQTDAAVNAGNSGGPIFNMKGEVVGIITAKYSGITNSGSSIEGIGFAIPIDDVSKKIDDIVKYGYVTGGYLGVMVHDVDREAAQYYGLPYGVYVQSTTEGFCAEKAGVRARDIIVALGDRQVTNMNDLTRALQEYQGGETTTITVWRAGLEVELEITLDPKPQQ